MKNIGLLVVVALLHQLPAYGCDVCGSAGMANTNALWGRQTGHRFGLGYQQSNFRSSHLPQLLSSGNTEAESTRERFAVLQLNGSHALGEGKVSLNWTLPMVQVQKEHVTPEYGLGDLKLGVAWLMVSDTLWNASWQIQSAYELKLPTGRYDAGQVDEQVSRYMFPGTGSVDQVFGINIYGSLNKNRWASQFSFRRNGRTRDGLNWGDQWTGSLAYFHDFQWKDFRIGTGIWAIMEHRQKDEEAGFDYRFSGYDLMLLSPELQLQKGSWMLSTKYQLPVYSQIAEGQVQILTMWNIQLTYKL